MPLNPDTQIPKFAIEQNTSVGILTQATPTIGTLGSNTNGVEIVPTKTFGTRIVSLIANTDDTATGGINVLLYEFKSSGSIVLPIGMVNIPFSSGNTFAARFHVNMLSLTNLPGLQIDSATRMPIILLGKGSSLRATTLANLSSGASCWIRAASYEYLG